MLFVTTGLADTCIRYGERDALYCDDEVVSYFQLATRVEYLCQVIRERGLSGQPILIHLSKSIDYVVAIYAVLATGNCYVPIDASQPWDRVALILKQAAPGLVITSRAFSHFYTDVAIPSLTIDNLEFGGRQLGHREMKQAIGSWYQPEDGDLAAILFTSGSTGTPKGVKINHGMLNFFISWAVTELGLCNRDILSNHASFAFDLSTFDLFAGSRVGAAVWVITKEQQHDVSALLKGIERFSVSVWYSVPTVLSMLVASGELTSRQTKQLRHVIFAGEPYPISALRQLCECLPRNCQLSNWYGPTETNVCFSFRFLNDGIEFDCLSSLPIGRPLPGLVTMVIDEQEEEISCDKVQGELLVAGACVTPGYSNLADHRNFQHHKRGCHATGDIVHCEEGLFYYHGRLDDQVKINGNRVELGEIEACLSRMPGIKEVAVVSKLNEQQQKLIAYMVVSGDKQNINLLTVKQFVSERLPKYMVPHAVRFVSSLPVNMNGKVDRHRLKNEE